MKKYILLFILLFSIPLGVQVQAEKFKDINDLKEREAILYLHKEGIIFGYEDGTFQPEARLTREHFIYLVGRYLTKNGYKLPEDALTVKRFDDISLANHSLAQTSALLFEEGLFIGSNGQLMPKSNITKEQAALVLVRLIEESYYIPLNEMVPTTFSPTVLDYKTASNKAMQEAIRQLNYVEIIQDTKFLPKNALNRAQFSQLLYNAILFIEEEVKKEDNIIYGNTIDTNQSIVLPNQTKLFASRNLNHHIATTNEEIKITDYEVLDKYIISFQLGEEMFYVHMGNVTNGQNKKEHKKSNLIGNVQTKSNYRVYLNKNHQPIFTSKLPVKLKVQAFEEGFYKVDFGGGSAYVHSEDINIIPGKNIQLNEPVILYQNGAVKAKFSAGAVVEFVQKSEKYTVISVGGSNYRIQSENYVETDKQSSVLKKVSSAYPVTIVAKSDVAIKDVHGNQLSTISKGKKVTLKQLSINGGVIDFLNGAAYVDLESFQYENLVTGSKKITYDEMVYKIKALHQFYPQFTELKVIGKSVEGRDIYAIKLGSGKKEILMDAAMHAREYMTPNVLMEMLDVYGKAYASNQFVGKYAAKEILSKVSIWFVPMINPDGVTLAQGGKVKTSTATLRQINGGSYNFSRWKANIRGVDLNRNFDVRWKQIKAVQPAYKNYKGSKPFSEPESIALKKFIDERPFKAYITYHSSGQIIYWDYGATTYNRAKQLVASVSNVTRYPMHVTNQKLPTAASESYFAKKKDAPAMTIEIAPYAGEGPVPFNQWSGVWQKNQTIGLLAASMASKY